VSESPVVIVGGGVAGLSAALGLGRAGHRVVVVDRDDLTTIRTLADLEVLDPSAFVSPGSIRSRGVGRRGSDDIRGFPLESREKEEKRRDD